MKFLLRTVRKGILFYCFTFLFCLQAGEHSRGSSEPFLSGDTFRSYADHLFDETSENLHPQFVKEGEIIFVKADMLGRFFLEKHPYIKQPYVLITHNSDEKMPGNFAKFLDDPNILQWFAQNIEGDSHWKLINLPIGLANRRWAHGSIEALSLARANIPKIPRNRLLYLNIAVETYPRERKRVHKMFRNQPYCYSPSTKPFKEYLEDLASCKFVLSPRGNGIDCHRTWEALYMGAIPIVRTSTLDPMYEGLPVLIVGDWSEITQEFLEKKYDEISQKQHDLQKLQASYWRAQLNKYKKG